MSQNTTISSAIRTLQELMSGLDQAFWEASSVERKDYFYDLISALHAELSELNKLSVQDHDLDYEPITQEVQRIRGKLSGLRKCLDEYLVRSATAARLETLIHDAVLLLANK